MPKHSCIDTRAPYARHEVMVGFERAGPVFRLVAAIDERGDDILADLDEARRDDQRRELADADRAPSGPVRPPSTRDVGFLRTPR